MPGIIDSVSAGQTVARVGSTGVSTGNHVHLEVLVDGELAAESEADYYEPWAAVIGDKTYLAGGRDGGNGGCQQEGK